MDSVYVSQQSSMPNILGQMSCSSNVVDITYRHRTTHTPDLVIYTVPLYPQTKFLFSVGQIGHVDENLVIDMLVFLSKNAYLKICSTKYSR